jgi:hypothetical protein
MGNLKMGHFEMPMSMYDPEHGPLIDIESAIAWLKLGTTYAQRQGYRRYVKQRKKLEKSGLVGADLRVAALLATMRADGFNPPVISVKSQVH